jgi:hypothetical protein
MMEFHHITALKYVKWLSEKYSDNWTVCRCEAPVSWPICPHDLSPLNIFCGDILKLRAVPVQMILDRNCVIRLRNL